jgi:hypothetical protein
MRRASRADHHGALALEGGARGVVGGVEEGARELLAALEADLVRRPVGAGAEDELAGRHSHRLAVAAPDGGGPAARARIPGRALAGGGGPDVELEDRGVSFEPVAHLVLRAEDRPGLGEGEVGEVVVPDGVVEDEAAIAVAPAVARAGVLLDDQRGHAEAPEPRAKRDAALARADHQHFGLVLAANARQLGPRVASDHVVRWRSALWTIPAGRVRPRGSSCPLRSAIAVRSTWARPSTDRDAAGAVGHARLKGDPRGKAVLRLLRRAGAAPAGRRGPGEAVAQHRGDGVAPFDREDVPSEGSVGRASSRRVRKAPPLRAGPPPSAPRRSARASRRWRRP